MTAFHREPVTTTKRKGSTPSSRERMHGEQGGKCVLCGNPMVAGEKLIDEHMKALGLGGSNDSANRALVHADCAYEKTFGKDGDAARIAKAKRQKIAALGLKTAPRQQIHSAPFPKPPSRHAATAPLTKRLPDRARALYTPSEDAR